MGFDDKDLTDTNDLHGVYCIPAESIYHAGIPYDQIIAGATAG
ncbi:hypothetical protein MTBBW1_2550010 [Desulfamplus magnetovallimortis]|uniref:Uncharacterized protein n=1 Tax=Desulfamplus magnetovallimortis TaxID=1246637 RepID=A0A1W1HEU8_9BACT|nr:hypothetical protein MTBBW1_2550010 [Desulfamplus magnetovallimortis]